MLLFFEAFPEAVKLHGTFLVQVAQRTETSCCSLSIISVSIRSDIDDNELLALKTIQRDVTCLPAKITCAGLMA